MTDKRGKGKSPSLLSLPRPGTDRNLVNLVDPQITDPSKLIARSKFKRSKVGDLFAKYFKKPAQLSKDSLVMTCDGLVIRPSTEVIRQDISPVIERQIRLIEQADSSITFLFEIKFINSAKKDIEAICGFFDFEPMH